MYIQSNFNKEENLLYHFIQTKQRIDLEVNFKNRMIIGTTKLTFLKKTEIFEQEVQQSTKQVPQYYKLNLNLRIS